MTITYQCAAATQWVVETDGIVLLNRETGATCRLEYPEAAIWDFITRGYTYDCMLPMLSSIISLDDSSIHTLLAKSLAEWEQSGYLVKTQQDGESLDHNTMS